MSKILVIAMYVEPACTKWNIFWPPGSLMPIDNFMELSVHIFIMDCKIQALNFW